GNKDKQPLSFDPEIERTLRKLRKQAKLHEHIHEIPFEEALEGEELADKTSDNMASNEYHNRGRKLADFLIPSATAGSARSVLWESFRRSQSTHCQLSPYL
ncbi:hypothetical protein PIB30_100736, partial [Stylosanthes scabra]|nr:hypothetical protein [Stylosanthes scabra]